MSIAPTGESIAPLEIKPGDVIFAPAASRSRMLVRDTFRGHPSKGRELSVVVLDEPFKGAIDTIFIPWSSPVTRYDDGLDQ